MSYLDQPVNSSVIGLCMAGLGANEPPVNTLPETEPKESA